MAQFIASGLCTAGVIGLVAMGFGMVYYANRVLSIAHGAIYVTAGYATHLIMVEWRMPLAIAILAAVGCAAAVGSLVEVFVYSPLHRKNASGSVMFISSLGVYIVIVNLMALLFGNDNKILRPGVETTMAVAGAILTKVQAAQILVSASVFVMFYLFLFRSQYGRVARAMADNPELASVLGINVRLNRVTVAAVGSALVGLGGFLGFLSSALNPYVGFAVVLSAAVACIVGGLGNFMAPVLGALLLGLLESLTVWRLSAKWSGLTTFALLILFMLFLPGGLLGIKRRLSER